MYTTILNPTTMRANLRYVKFAVVIRIFFFEAVTIWRQLGCGKTQQYLQWMHGKVGSYMLDNLRKVDILQLSNFLDQKVKISSRRCKCSLSRLKGGGSMRSDKSLFSKSITKIIILLNFPTNLRFRFPNKYIKNENCNLRLSFLIVGRHFSNLIGKLFQLIS